MVNLNEEVKNEICEALLAYKKGEPRVFLEEGEKLFIETVRPHFYENKKIGDARRIRFNICSENSWNRMILNDEQKRNLLTSCKAILDKHKIEFEEIRLTSYYPYMDSRMQYASWNRCLEIICKAS